MDKARAEKAKPQNNNHHKHFNPQLEEIIRQLKTTNKYLKNIMSAQTKLNEMVEEMLTLIQEAWNTNVGDLTEAEVEAKRAEMRERLLAILNPVTP